MKNVDGYELYKELNNIDPALIEEAGTYENITRKGLNKKYIKNAVSVFGVVAAAVGIIAFATIGLGGIGLSKKHEGIVDATQEENVVVKSYAVNLYAAGPDEELKELIVNGNKNASASGITVGCSFSQLDKSVGGDFFCNLSVTGEGIDNIKYTIKTKGADYSYSLLGMKVADKESQEYLSSAHRLRKKIDDNYVYYMSENYNTEHTLSGADGTNFWNWITFKRSVSVEEMATYDKAKVFSEVCEDLTVEVCVTFDDGETCTYNLGFKPLNSEDYSGDIVVYLK